MRKPANCSLRLSTFDLLLSVPGGGISQACEPHHPLTQYIPTAGCSESPRHVPRESSRSSPAFLGPSMVTRGKASELSPLSQSPLNRRPFQTKRFQELLQGWSAKFPGQASELPGSSPSSAAALPSPRPVTSALCTPAETKGTASDLSEPPWL